MNYSWNRQSRLNLLSLALLSLLASLAIQAQTKDPGPESFAGHFKGTVKRAAGDMDLTLDIKWADAKFSGRALAGEKEYPVSSGEVVGGKLTLKLGTGNDVASLTLQKIDDKVVGDWMRASDKGTVELKTAPVFTADALNGEWDAVADAQGQPFPFTLTLKVEGEKVNGSSSSQLGTSAISSGTWKDGKLAVVLEGGAGQIALMATMIDGKLSGDYDFAGQLSGKWVAIKKK